jgi:endonuclease YncB( thermonuclease family)
MRRWEWLFVALVVASPAMAKPAGKQEPKPAVKAEPKPLEGKVTRVVDGDTLIVEPDAGGEAVTVRVQGIDAPEICQGHGPEAKRALEEMVLQQPVMVVGELRDDNGRLLGKLLKGTQDVGDRMVRDGHAWSYRYKYDRGPYVAEERMAHSLRRGLHREPEALEPREFRKRHGACTTPSA